MASNKNQHYVPRCLLRPFTKDGDGRCINLFNLDRRRFVRGAPVKNQCSGDYFYGKDPNLELAIQGMEARYGMVRDAVHAPGYRFTDEHRQALRDFWLFQYMRTDAAAQCIAQMANDASDFFMGGDPHFRMEIKSAVHEAMRVYTTGGESIRDLKVCLVRNRSAVPFITSDDPAVLANRLHQHQPNLRGRSFSLVSAGALLLLPLSPTVLCLGYDGDIYRIPHEKGWAVLKQDRDASALNEHQLLNACANVFMAGEPYDVFEQAVAQASGRRLDARYRITYMVSEGHTKTGERFRVVSRAEAEEHREALMQWQQLHAKASLWPQLIGFRPDAGAHTNGSVVGWVRKAQRKHPSARPFKKIKIN